MDVVLFCLVVLTLSAFVAAPLYRNTEERRTAAARTDGQQESIFRALRDLEIDRASGLIDDQAYDAERQILEAQAVALDPGDPATD